MLSLIAALFLFAPILAMSATTGPAPVFEDSMAQRTIACTACHGKEGRAAPDGFYPRIAGKPPGYLYNQLLNFRDGRRHYGLMARLLDPLSDKYLLEMAQYFSALDLPYPQPSQTDASQAVLQRGQAIVMQGDTIAKVPACIQCHGDALTGALPTTPGLLGLPRDYLSAQLGAWKTGQRRAHAPDCMGEIAKQLRPEDVNAVASWLASQPLPVDPKPVAALQKPPAIQCGSALLPAGRQKP